MPDVGRHVLQGDAVPNILTQEAFRLPGDPGRSPRSPVARRARGNRLRRDGVRVDGEVGDPCPVTGAPRCPDPGERPGEGELLRAGRRGVSGVLSRPAREPLEGVARGTDQRAAAIRVPGDDDHSPGRSVLAGGGGILAGQPVSGLGLGSRTAWAAAPALGGRLGVAPAPSPVGVDVDGRHALQAERHGPLQGDGRPWGEADPAEDRVARGGQLVEAG